MDDDTPNFHKTFCFQTKLNSRKPVCVTAESILQIHTNTVFSGLYYFSDISENIFTLPFYFKFASNYVNKQTYHMIYTCEFWANNTVTLNSPLCRVCINKGYCAEVVGISAIFFMTSWWLLQSAKGILWRCCR